MGCITYPNYMLLFYIALIPIYEDSMDQHRQIKSIEEVQQSENHASKSIADANAEKERTIADAKEKADKIVSNAVIFSRGKKDDTIKKFISELEDKRKKAIEHALKESKSIRAKRLSEVKRKELVNRLARIILGE